MKLRTKKLLMSWATFIVMCLFLTFVNYMTSPDNWWVVWVYAGWGLGQLLATARYFFYGDDEADNSQKESNQ